MHSDKLAKDDPVGLVRILRIVENEQLTNASSTDYHNKNEKTEESFLMTLTKETLN